MWSLQCVVEVENMVRLNESISSDTESEAIMEIISEIDDRDELLCTGYACGADATFI